MKKQIYIFLILVLGLMLSACTPSSKKIGLAGTEWQLVSYGTPGNQTPAAADVETSLSFGTDGQFNGNFGCNSFGGKYDMKDGSIEFSEVISTMMACEEPRMTQETTSLQVLNGTAAYKLDGFSLTLTNSESNLSIGLLKVDKK